MKTVLKVILVVGLLAALTSCEFFGSKPELTAPGHLSISAKGEAMTISWAAVTDASDYDLYYTDDGTSPNLNSAAIANVTSPYSHLNLDARKTYKYMLRARADGFTSSNSPISEGYRPEPMMHITVTATGYANQPLLLYMFDAAIPGDPITTEIVIGITDSDGVCVLHGTMNYDIYPGYTIVKDLDANGLMSTGDQVWGDNGSNTYAYLKWSVLPEYSWNRTQDWDNWKDTDPVTQTY